MRRNPHGCVGQPTQFRGPSGLASIAPPLSLAQLGTLRRRRARARRGRGRRSRPSRGVLGAEDEVDEGGVHHAQHQAGDGDAGVVEGEAEGGRDDEADPGGPLLGDDLLEALQPAGGPPDEVEDEGEDDREHQGPLRGRQHVEVGGQLAEHDRLEGAEAVVADVLEQPAQVAAALLGPGEVDEAGDQEHDHGAEAHEDGRTQPDADAEEHEGDAGQGRDQRERAADVGAPERRRVDDQDGPQQAQGHGDPAAPPDAGREQAGEDRGRRRQLGERQVAQAGETPGHRGRVAEDRVELQGGAHQHVQTEHAEHEEQHTQQRVGRPPAQEALGGDAQQRAAADEVGPERRRPPFVEGKGPGDVGERQDGEDGQAGHLHGLAAPARLLVQGAHGDDPEDQLGDHEQRGDQCHHLVAPLGLGVGLLQPLPPLDRRAPGLGALPVPPLHRVRPRDVEQGEDRRGHVDAGDEAAASGHRRFQQAGLDAGGPQGGEGQVVAAGGRVGPDHHDRVSSGVDALQQPTQELVGALQGQAALAGPLRSRGQGPVAVGPHEVGRLDQYDGVVDPGRVEGRHHLLLVQATAEGRLRVGLEQVVTDAARRHQALGVHQADDRLAGEDGLGLLVGAVRRGDDRGMGPTVAQRIAEGAHLGAEVEAVVDVVQGGQGQAEQPRVHGRAGAPGEDLLGRLPEVALADFEGQAVEVRITVGPGPGVDGRVTVAGSGPAVHRPGGEAPDGRLVEQGGQVRQVEVVGLGPTEGRHGEDEDPLGPGHGVGRRGVRQDGHQGQPGQDRQEDAPHEATAEFRTSGPGNRCKPRRPP